MYQVMKGLISSMVIVAITPLLAMVETIPFMAAQAMTRFLQARVMLLYMAVLAMTLSPPKTLPIPLLMVVMARISFA